LANRVARFAVEPNPQLDPLLVRAPSAVSAVLGPGQLLYQLELSATRLKGLLDALRPEEWAAEGRAGARRARLGDLIDAVLQRGLDDLSNLLDGQTSRTDRSR
jgi:hypothetical protein